MAKSPLSKCTMWMKLMSDQFCVSIYFTLRSFKKKMINFFFFFEIWESLWYKLKRRTIKINYLKGYGLFWNISKPLSTKYILNHLFSFFEETNNNSNDILTKSLLVLSLLYYYYFFSLHNANIFTYTIKEKNMYNWKWISSNYNHVKESHKISPRFKTMHLTCKKFHNKEIYFPWWYNIKD